MFPVVGHLYLHDALDIAFRGSIYRHGGTISPLPVSVVQLLAIFSLVLAWSAVFQGRAAVRRGTQVKPRMPLSTIWLWRVLNQG